MKTHGHYTTPAPHIPGLPRRTEIALVVAILVIIGVGLLFLIYRFSTPPEAAPPPVAVTAPAPGEAPVAAPNRRFADEILAVRAAPAGELALVDSVPARPVVYDLPERAPALWASCRPCADEALGALRAPALRTAPAAPQVYVVTAPVPDTAAGLVRSRFFSDEVVGSGTTLIYIVEPPALVARAGPQ